MGFLDKLLKGAVDAIGDKVLEETGVKSDLNNLLNQALNIKDQALQTGASSSGTENSLPDPKPAEQITGTLYDSGRNTTYSLMLSGDFVAFRSGAAEVDFSAAYAPDFDKEKDGDPYTPDSSCFVIMNDAESEVVDLFKQYRQQGVAPKNTLLFEPVSGLGEKIFCKLKMKLRGQILYCYGMDRGNTYSNCYLGALYPPKVMGTPLENRLIKEVDQAIKSYHEN